MLTLPSFKKSLILEQFQGNYLYECILILHSKSCDYLCKFEYRAIKFSANSLQTLGLDALYWHNFGHNSIVSVSSIMCIMIFYQRI